ncbi:MAG: RluA family pseudouridine synthase, partial [Armatimonadia bacterium]
MSRMTPKPMLVSFAEAGMPLAAFLARRLETSGKQAKRLLDERVVFVNRRRVWMARHRLQAGDEVEIPATSDLSAPGKSGLPILYRDAEYVIVNKPPGLSSDGAGSAEARMKQMLGPTLQAVHRLDRDTSGCLWFSTNAKAREAAVALFQSKEVTKTYHAIVAGRVSAGGTTIDTPLDDQPATTHVRPLSVRFLASHVKVLIETGRTHQIRKHLASIGHPVLGDKSYALRAIQDEQLRQAPRQMLHASGLAFRHPATGQAVRVKAPLPADLKRMLRELKLKE